MEYRTEGSKSARGICRHERGHRVVIHDHRATVHRVLKNLAKREAQWHGKALKGMEDANPPVRKGRTTKGIPDHPLWRPLMSQQSVRVEAIVSVFQ